MNTNPTPLEAVAPILEQIKNLNSLGLKKFRVFENQTHWNQVITAKNKEQARDKAWNQFWAKLPFTHCNKESLEVREV